MLVAVAQASAKRARHVYGISEWGGRDCLLKLEYLSVVSELKEELGGDALIVFSMPEFAARAQVVYDSLGIIQITFENVWAVFTSMLPLAFV